MKTIDIKWLQDEQKKMKEDEEAKALKTKQQKWKCFKRFQKIVNYFLESKIYTIFMMIVTLYALFADDFRVLVTP